MRRGMAGSGWVSGWVGHSHVKSKSAHAKNIGIYSIVDDLRR